MSDNDNLTLCRCCPRLHTTGQNRGAWTTVAQPLFKPICTAAMSSTASKLSTRVADGRHFGLLQTNFFFSAHTHRFFSSNHHIPILPYGEWRMNQKRASLGRKYPHDLESRRGCKQYFLFYSFYLVRGSFLFCQQLAVLNQGGRPTLSRIEMARTAFSLEIKLRGAKREGWEEKMA